MKIPRLRHRRLDSPIAPALSGGSRLLILDDVFPNLLTGFRVAEFNAYLGTFADCQVLTVQHWFATASGAVGFEASHAEYAARYPEFADRVSLFEGAELPAADLAYLVFLNNGALYIPHLERAQLPFVITIYPGGGMELDQPETDAKLRRVLGSDLCRGVIVTQQVTYDYLVGHGFVEPERVVKVFGVVAADTSASNVAGTTETAAQPCRARFGVDKDVLDVVFAAHKYTATGVDKGYDVFLDAARLIADGLSQTGTEVRFHVVGTWAGEDYPTDGLDGRLYFHGLLDPTQLRALYLRCDLIVSPNRPFQLSPGGYDGYPLGSCVEAGLVGTAVMASNELAEQAFVDGEDIIVVKPEATEVARRVLELAAKPKDLERLGENARRVFSIAYSNATQLTPRLRMLGDELRASQ
jgi:lipopolysaccharide transport system ATP-binding protein